MDGEFNPRRRYKDFRPRQAVRAFKNTGVPTNLATVSIFNDSTGPFVLMVRDLEISGNANDLIALSFFHAQVGTSQGNTSPLASNEARQNGLIASIDTATVYPADFTAPLTGQGVYYWWHDFPVAAIWPGWALVIQDGTAAHALAVSALWESIAIDELDFFY